ncbi:MAG: hypothetical protein M3O67_10330 [Bacteroidota bacterium]|nr:hypothetical protein [Bacteroidota bacterium]
MKQIILCIGFIIINIHLYTFSAPRENQFNYIAESIDSLPMLLAENREDLIESS